LAFRLELISQGFSGTEKGLNLSQFP